MSRTEPSPETRDILVPGSLVLHVYREAYAMLANAANEVLPLVERVDCELHPERLTESLRRFDRARGLLDALGWELPDWDTHVAVEQQQLLLDALTRAAGTQKGMIEAARQDGVDSVSVRELARELAELTAYVAVVRDL
jgi:hypothetical protein